jgi:group I intron endonuclease
MIIYKVENKISGKVYIGQTIHTLKVRKNAHLKMIEVGKSKFYKALKSYGVDNFDWVVIDTAITKDELNKKEIHYIREYNSIENGYNMVEGGAGGYNDYAVIANKKKMGKPLSEIVSPEMYEQSIEGRKRGFKNGLSHYTFDKIDKEKQREIARKGAYKLVEMGYTHSEETKKKISEAQKGITFEDRYGVEVANIQKQIISQKTKEAMKTVDWDSLMEKALEGRKIYWDTKHSADKDKILELKQKGYKVKHICAELDISTPTYYKRLKELEKIHKI